MKKTVSILVVVLMIIVSSINTQASATKTFKEDIQYKEVTDARDLLTYWLLLNDNEYVKKNPAITKKFLINSEEDEYIISITQLLEQKTEKNGAVVRTFATSNLTIVDDNNELINREQLRSIVIHNGSSIEYLGNYNVGVKYTAYWQWYVDDSINDYARCYRSTAQVVSTSSTYWVTKFEHSFFENVDGIYEIEDIVTNLNPTAYQVYDAFNPHTQFFNITLYFSRVDAGIRVTYNTGTTAETSINIKQAVQNAAYFGD